MNKFRTILIHRLAELHVMRETQQVLIQYCGSISLMPALKRKLAQIQDMIDLNNEFYKLVERCL